MHFYECTFDDNICFEHHQFVLWKSIDFSLSLYCLLIVSAFIIHLRRPLVLEFHYVFGNLQGVPATLVHLTGKNHKAPNSMKFGVLIRSCPTKLHLTFLSFRTPSWRPKSQQSALTPPLAPDSLTGPRQPHRPLIDPEYIQPIKLLVRQCIIIRGSFRSMSFYWVQRTTGKLTYHENAAFAPLRLYQENYK